MSYSKKILLSSIVLLISNVSTVRPMLDTLDNLPTSGKVVASLLLAGGGTAGTLWAVNTPVGKKVCRWLHMNPDDARNVVGATTLLGTLGVGSEWAFGSNTVSDSIKELSVLTPVAAGCGYITSSGLYKKTVQNVPGLGVYAQTKKEEAIETPRKTNDLKGKYPMTKGVLFAMLYGPIRVGIDRYTSK